MSSPPPDRRLPSRVLDNALAGPHLRRGQEAIDQIARYGATHTLAEQAAYADEVFFERSSAG